MKSMSASVLSLILLFVGAPAAAQRPASVVRTQAPALRVEGSVRIGLPIGGHRLGHVHHDACRRWVPAHCDTVTERVWVAPRRERVWVEATYRVVTDGRGRSRRICDRPGHWHVVQHPGRWQNVSRTIHVPGRWQTVCGR
jgi:hypothetical protein